MSSNGSPLAIRVEHLSKRYRLGGRQGYQRFGEALVRALKRPFRPGAPSKRSAPLLWAIKDISFDVHAGEIVGIIGQNGAGKTTLLKILAQISHPTGGRAEIYGKVGSLLEVGTGFHPELNGRENVYLNGAILGMRRTEITRKYDEIVDFAQVEEFMDTPVKYYSTGMRVRLAFAVAAYLDPEILFIDEVLSVGDASFQAKCLKKMEEVAGAGRTVLFVSHNLGAVTGLCTRCIWVDHGEIRMDASPADVVEAYLATGYSNEARWVHPTDAHCGADARLDSVEITGPDGSPRSQVPFDEPFHVRVTAEVSKPVRDLRLGLRVTDTSGAVIFSTANTDDQPDAGVTDPGRFTYDCEVPAPLLRPGRYMVSALALTRYTILDEHHFVVGFDVLPGAGKANPGVIIPRLRWTLETPAARAVSQ